MPEREPLMNYYELDDAALASAWRKVDADSLAVNYEYDDDLIERLNMVEDAILQRINAPDDASGDEPKWQAKIRAFGQRN